VSALPGIYHGQAFEISVYLTIRDTDGDEVIDPEAAATPVMTIRYADGTSETLTAVADEATAPGTTVTARRLTVSLTGTETAALRLGAHDYQLRLNASIIPLFGVIAVRDITSTGTPTGSVSGYASLGLPTGTGATAPIAGRLIRVAPDDYHVVRVQAGGVTIGGGVTAHAGGGFRMNKGQHLGLAPGQGCLDLGGVHRGSPSIFDCDHLGTGPAGHVDHAGAEHAIDADHRQVARLQQVHQGRFHACRARRRQGHADVIWGVEQPRERGLDLLHQTLKGRIQMADGRPRQGRQHPGADIGRARPHQDPAGRLKALHGGLALMAPGPGLISRGGD
jgi:hypothetical protein